MAMAIANSDLAALDAETAAAIAASLADDTYSGNSNSELEIRALSLSPKGATPQRWIVDLADHEIGMMPHPHIFYHNRAESTGAEGQDALNICCQTCHRQYNIHVTQGSRACKGLLHHLHSEFTDATVVAECCHCGTAIHATLEQPTIPPSMIYRLRKARKPESAAPDVPHFHQTLALLIRIVGNAAVNSESKPLNSASAKFMSDIGLDNVSKEFFEFARFTLNGQHYHVPERTPDMIHFWNRCRFQLQLVLLQENKALLTELLDPAHPIILDRLRSSIYQRDPKEKFVNLNDKSALSAERTAPLGRMGCLSDMSDDIIIDTFQTQVSHDPTTAHPLVNILVETQKKRGSEKLDLEIACKKSDGIVTSQELTAAYRNFEIPDNGEGISSEVLLGLIRASLNTASKENLRIISRARKDKAIDQLLEPSIESPFGGGAEEEDPSLDIFYAQNPVGLSNIGNTCYFNSLLQYLYTVKEFRESILNMEAYIENIDAEDWSERVVDNYPVSRSLVAEAIDVVKELKGLYSLMEGSKSRSVAPSERLVELLLSSGHKGQTNSDTKRESNQLFAQQDMSEAMMHLMQRLRTAFTPVKLEGEGKLVDRFQHLLHMKQLHRTIEAHEEKPEKEEGPVYEDQEAIIIQVNEDVTMEELLDDYFGEPNTDMDSDAVKGPQPSSSKTLKGKAVHMEEYERKGESQEDSNVTISGDSSTTPEPKELLKLPGEKTVVAFPPILHIHLVRTLYDAESGRPYKSDAKVAIPKRLFMDQYLESNQEENADRIKRLKVWKRDRRECRRVLEHIRKKRKEHVKKLSSAEANCTTGTDTVDHIFSGEINPNGEVLDDYGERTEDLASERTEEPLSLDNGKPEKSGLIENPAHENCSFDAEAKTEVVADCLSEFDKEEAEQLAKIADLTARLRDEVADLPQAEEYRIHAIFHHEGGINFGHYWVYIFDDQLQESRWIKYSDEFVSEVSVAQESEVFNGSQACFCVYVRANADVMQTVWRSIA